MKQYVPGIPSPWGAQANSSNHRFKVGYILDKSLAYHRTIHSYSQLRVTSYPNMHVFRVREEARVPRENMKTPHRKPCVRIKPTIFLL